MNNLMSTTICLFLFLFCCTLNAQNETFVRTQLGFNNFLNRPWDLNYGPDDYLWVTERERGVVVRVDLITAERDELISLSDVYSDAGQDGLLGLAIHSDLLGDNPYVYLSYTYLVDGQRKQKIVRYTYEIDGKNGSLSAPMILIDSLPSSNDHNSGRLIFGPDQKLYYSIGDQGGNQNRNFCNPILSQVLPTQEEIDVQDWTNYPGKILRLNLDGSIPEDNPTLNGVKSHIYSYGHRNPQGLIFGSNGLLYSNEHGPNTDDEVNLLTSGDNYGWPNVVGFLDDQAYDYCNWSSASNCPDLDYQNGACPDNATLLEESSFKSDNYREPLFSMFAVTDDYDFNNPICGNAWMCRPNVAPSSLAIYESNNIPGWQNSLLVTSLKRGRVYRLQLDEEGTAVVGDTTELFYSQNRYRDIVVAPDGKTFYVITDQTGRTSDKSGLNVADGLQNPGTILKFTLQETVSTDEVSNNNDLRVWPNPASDKLFIEINTRSMQNLQAELITTTGQILRQYSNLHQGVNEIALNDLPAGAYFLRAYSKGHIWQKRVVIH